MSILCLGEVWLELNAATAPELTETFRVQTGGWGAGFCRQYAALGGQAIITSAIFSAVASAICGGSTLP